MKKIKKLHLFILSLIFGLTVTIKPALTSNFSQESLHEWILNGLLVAAIVGFVAMKYLKSKGRID
ncbi:MAG: hypothetical protein GX776_06540 [Oxalobacter sp.]|nr:hypothetical protein [Oxalobacter sp.]